jgi:serine/threonine protein kinase
MQVDDDGIEQFIDLVASMLVYEPAKRVSCLQAVSHPFFM